MASSSSEKKGSRGGAASHADKRRWKKRREPLDLNLIIAQEDVDNKVEDTPTWASSHAGPAAQLPRRLCCCCGFPARYRCPLCCSSNKRSSSSSSKAADVLVTCSSSSSNTEEGLLAAAARQSYSRYVCSIRCMRLHQAADCAPKHLLLQQ